MFLIIKIIFYTFNKTDIIIIFHFIFLLINFFLLLHNLRSIRRIFYVLQLPDHFVIILQFPKSPTLLNKVQILQFQPFDHILYINFIIFSNLIFQLSTPLRKPSSGDSLLKIIIIRTQICNHHRLAIPSQRILQNRRQQRISIRNMRPLSTGLLM
jgi:hypothetical protein